MYVSCTFKKRETTRDTTERRRTFAKIVLCERGMRGAETPGVGCRAKIVVVVAE
jgi:hypothetical protein